MKKIKEILFLLYIFRYAILAVLLSLAGVSCITLFWSWMGEPTAVWWTCDVFGVYCPAG